MERILLMFAGAVILGSCSLTNPGSSNGLDIQVADATFGPQNNFTATVTFTNNLGRDVDLFNLGCRSTDSTFDPSFVMEHFVDSRWDTFASPLCADLAVPPTTLSDGKTFTTVVSLAGDTTAAGTFRLSFDIREQNSTQPLPRKDLLSNSFSIAK